MWSISPSVPAEFVSASTSWQSAWSMSRRSAAPRRTGLSPTGTIPVIPAATNTEEKNGVFSNSPPTGGGRLGSSRARSAAATAAPCRRWSRQLTNESSKWRPRSSISTSGASRSATVGRASLTSPPLPRKREVPPPRPAARAASSSGAQLSGGVRQLATDLQQLTGGAAQRYLGLLGGQEVAVHRVVGVDADAAVDVNDAVRHPMPGISCPECGGGDLGVGRQILAESPRRLGQCQSQPLDVDVAVRQPLADRLEAADRAVELFTGLCVFGGQLQPSLEHAELERAAAQNIQRPDPVDDILAADDTCTTDLDPVEPQVPDAAQAGGVQCGHGDARVAAGNQENGSAGIGFGRHHEAVGDRPVRDLGAGPGQSVAVAGRCGLHRSVAHFAIQGNGEDLLAVHRGDAPLLLEFGRAEPG